MNDGALMRPCALGLPWIAQAAQRLKQQYLGEFMSTRLGSQKKAEILSAQTRVAGDRTYYDIEVKPLLLSPSPPYRYLKLVG
jgi:hypothetical protein